TRPAAGHELAPPPNDRRVLVVLVLHIHTIRRRAWPVGAVATFFFVSSSRSAGGAAAKAPSSSSHLPPARRERLRTSAGAAARTHARARRRRRRRGGGKEGGGRIRSSPAGARLPSLPRPQRHQEAADPRGGADEPVRGGAEGRCRVSALPVGERVRAARPRIFWIGWDAG
ncbi:hypothetical protein PVAP13_9KG189270, partial [Panicum virgatum]